MEEMENSRVIIDTDILIDLLRGKEEARLLIEEFENKGYLLSTTAVNEFELYIGVHKSKQKKEGLLATKNLLAKLTIFPLTRRSAQKAGHIYADLEANGQSIGTADALIAGIALTKGFNLLTRNAAHFNKIKSLSVITTQNRETNQKKH
jgi:tRNA(fMet)-specific endonuclease VapC